MNSFYNDDELLNIGFKKIGKNVLISKKCSIYSPNKISLGSNVRIDDFCILSGNIDIGSNVHISAYTSLFGGGLIKIGDYCGCSMRCTLISASDDFSGNYMIGAVIPEQFKNVTYGKIIMNNYCQLGALTTILPNIEIGEGTVTGACSLVLKSLDSWSIYVGMPVKKIKNREKEILKIVKEYELWKNMN